MKRFFFLLAFALTTVLTGCQDTDDLWDEVDNLKSRVTALETQTKLLNDNLEALSLLSQKGATVTSVTQGADGSYTLTLSNGEVITLHQGSDTAALLPMVGIDAEGYWVVDCQDGSGFVRLLCNGEPVRAAATDGLTPRFRVSDDGLWQISYDGASYENVLDAAGKPVSALGSAEVTDKFFGSVAVSDGLLRIELLTGEVLEIPVVPGFYCRIVAPQGVQSFTAGSSKSYDVEIKGVDQVLLSAPQGWSVQLTDIVADKAKLTVIAPGSAAEAGRALADNTKDVAILALAGSYAAMAKIQVEVEGGVTVVPPSVVRVEAVEEAVAETELTFEVEVSDDADAWMWLCLESSAEAPAPDTLLVAGHNGTGTEVTVTELEPDTEYVLYVVAVKNPGTVSAVKASAPVRTLPHIEIDPNDYAETGVEIDGVRYDRMSEGAQLLTVEAAAEADTEVPVGEGGIYFLADESDAHGFVTSASKGIVKDLVLIGRYADRRPTLTATFYWALRNRTGKVVFKNLKLDYSAITNYVFNAQGADVGGVGALVFEDCEIVYKKVFLTMYNAPADAFLGRIVVRNCKIRYEAAESNPMFTCANLTGEGLKQFSQFVFENNILYSTPAEADLKPCSIFVQEQADGAGSLENLEIVFRNNTLVNFAAYGTTQKVSALLVVNKFKSIDMTANLFSDPQDKYFALMRIGTDYGASWPALSCDRTLSRAWGGKGWKIFFDNNMPSDFGTNTIVNYQEDGAVADPFATCDTAAGRFVRKPGAAAYGSSLE